MTRRNLSTPRVTAGNKVEYDSGYLKQCVSVVLVTCGDAGTDVGSSLKGHNPRGERGVAWLESQRGEAYVLVFSVNGAGRWCCRIMCSTCISFVPMAEFCVMILVRPIAVWAKQTLARLRVRALHVCV